MNDYISGHTHKKKKKKAWTWYFFCFPLQPNFVPLFSLQIKYKGAAEFSLGVLNFQREQDVRVKVGYEVFEKVE